MDELSVAVADRQADTLPACRCAQCGQVYFPRRDLCPVCGDGPAMLDAVVEGPGTLYASSVIHIAPKNFTVPYAVGYVDFPGNVRVLGQIAWTPGTQLRPGMAMTIGHGPIARERDGSVRESFVFHPVL